MTNKHTILKNRVIDFSFKKKIDQSTFNLVEALNYEVITIINNNLLKRPSTTISYLKSIITDLKCALDFLLNHISIPIQKKLYNKEDLTELEHHNFENLFELRDQIEDIIHFIEDSICSVEPQPRKKSGKPELIIKNNQPWKKAPIEDINATWQRLINEGAELSKRQIALLCFYENIVISKPSVNNVIANEIAKFHGHKSGVDLYNNHYLKVCKKTDRLNQHTRIKTKTDIEKIIEFLSTKRNKDNALNDLDFLNKKIEEEEN